jgi:glycosyltransferase involved in cell wall biosynthesis
MKISVVMPVFNGAQFILESVQSILNQDFDHFECIVINDGSTDETSLLLQSIKDKRLAIHEMPANFGMSSALNLGIIKAQGEYIAIMDADDIAFSNRLKLQVAFMDNHPDIHILGARSIRIKDNKENIIDKPLHPLIDSEIKSRMVLLNGSALLHPTTVIRKSFIDTYNLRYQLFRSSSNDHDFWVRCIERGVKFHTLEDILIYKRKHAHNISTMGYSNQNTMHAKTLCREKIMSMYYPFLNLVEIKSLVYLMQFNSNMSFSKAYLNQGINSAKKAMQDTNSYFGESKNYLKEILSFFIHQNEQLLNKAD